MTSRILAIGECMVELSQTDAGLYRRSFAGDTFNAAWYLRRLLHLDAEVSYATCIGEDAVSDEMLRFFETEGILTDAVRRVPDRTVGLYMISLDGGERSFSYWRAQSAARCLADDEAWLDRVLEKRDVVHLSGITLAILAPDARDRLCAALSRARSHGTMVSFDTNIRPVLWPDQETLREGIRAGAAVADIVLPSFDEEAAAFGDTSPEDTLARYRELGAGIVAVKQGAGPVLLWSDGGRHEEIPAIPVEDVVDTTAAGDSFAACLLAGLVKGRDPVDAARQAMSIAARVIRHSGALVRTAAVA